MFCSKCGTQLADTCAFCSRCGAPTQPANQPIPNNYVNQTQITNQNNVNSGTITTKQFTLETDTIITIVLSIIMVLTMLMLPMIKLVEERSRSIKILDDIIILKNTQVIFSRIAFIMMVGTLIALIIFKVTKKPSLFSLVSSGINLGALILYDAYICIYWITGPFPSHHNFTASLEFGGFVCIGCALALVVLSYIPFSKERIKAKTPRPVITYAPGYKP